MSMYPVCTGIELLFCTVVCEAVMSEQWSCCKLVVKSPRLLLNLKMSGKVVGYYGKG